MHRSARRARLALLVVVAVVASVFAVASPASAHVTVVADEASPGSYARVVFRVPNEGETATTGLEVHLLPAGEPPIPSARTAPVPGWSAEVEYETLDEPVDGGHGTTVDEAVSVIRWTAEGEDAGIQPGEFGEFPVMLGPLPDTEQLFFPTFQTYAGVDEPVEWIERPDPDGEEPPNPAPVLQLAASEPEDAGTDDPAAAGEADAGAAEDDDDAGSLGRAGVLLGVAGLVVALAAMALAGTAFARTRR